MLVFNTFLLLLLILLILLIICPPGIPILRLALSGPLLLKHNVPLYPNLCNLFLEKSSSFPCRRKACAIFDEHRHLDTFKYCRPDLGIDYPHNLHTPRSLSDRYPPSALPNSCSAQYTIDPITPSAPPYYGYYQVRRTYVASNLHALVAQPHKASILPLALWSYMSAANPSLCATDPRAPVTVKRCRLYQVSPDPHYIKDILPSEPRRLR